MSLVFPNESTAYRKARKVLLEAETQLREKVEQVAALRRQLPAGGTLTEDYAFNNLNNETVKLSELFEPGKNALVIYSYMFAVDDEFPCPACTSILDSLEGSMPHISQSVNLAVVISGSVSQAQQIFKARGWKNLNLLSCSGNTYNRDYFGENEQGKPMPMLNVFSKENTDITHFWGTELLYQPVEGHPRHVDQLWPLWNVLDLTPQGRVNNIPKLNYEA